MTGNVGKWISRPRRFKVAKDHEILVEVHRSTGSESTTIEARLLDLSCGGAKIAAMTQLLLNENVIMTTKIEPLDGELEADAKVTWTRPFDGETSWMGLSFDPEIPQEEIDRLARAGYVDRREHSREENESETYADWQIEDQRGRIKLKNVSEGGFCVSSSASVDTGQHVILKLSRANKPPLSVPCIVTWQLCKEDSFLVGCAFVDKKHYAPVKRIMDEQLEAEEAVQRVRRPLNTRPWTWVALLFVILWYGVHSVLF